MFYATESRKGERERNRPLTTFQNRIGIRIRRNKICRLHRPDNHDAPKARNPLMLNAYDF